MGVKSVTPKEIPFLVDVSFAYPSNYDSSKYVRVNKTFELTSRLHAGKVFNVLCDTAQEMPFPHSTMEGNGTELAASHKVFDGEISDAQRKAYRIAESMLRGPGAYDAILPDGRVVEFKLSGHHDIREVVERMHTAPVNPFMVGERTEGENRGRARMKHIPEVQGKFWMIVNCDVEVKRNLTEIVWPAKTCFDSRMEADKACVHMAEKHPGVRFAVLESVKDARVEMVTRKEVVTKDIVEPKLTVNRL